MSGTHGGGVSLSGCSALESAVGAGWGPCTLWGLFPKTGVPGAGGRELVPGYACAYEMGVIPLVVLKKAGKRPLLPFHTRKLGQQ